MILAVGLEPAQLPDGLDAFAVGHEEVGDDQRRPLVGEQGQPDIAVGRLDHRMLRLRQDAAHQQPHRRGVVDHQDDRHQLSWVAAPFDGAGLTLAIVATIGCKNLMVCATPAGRGIQPWPRIMAIFPANG